MSCKFAGFPFFPLKILRTLNCSIEISKGFKAVEIFSLKTMLVYEIFKTVLLVKDNGDAVISMFSISFIYTTIVYTNVCLILISQKIKRYNFLLKFVSKSNPHYFYTMRTI